MKINISRQNIYIIIISLVLLIFVLVFSFAFLIPEGKEYRVQRTELKKISKEVARYDDFDIQTLELLTTLKSDHRNIITAFDRTFSQDKFQKQHASYFKTLILSKRVKAEDEGEFMTYDVNTTSQINSPKSFYDFLDAINKSDWIISINFPINFKRDAELIHSTFSMKVYSNNKDKNTTADLNSTK